MSHVTDPTTITATWNLEMRAMLADFKKQIMISQAPGLGGVPILK